MTKHPSVRVPPTLRTRLPTPNINIHRHTWTTGRRPSGFIHAEREGGPSFGRRSLMESWDSLLHFRRPVRVGVLSEDMNFTGPGDGRF